MLKIRYMGFLLGLSALLSSGAQTYAQEAKPLANSAQSIKLSPKDCALFIWVGYPSRLLFISHSTDYHAYSAHDGEKNYSITPHSAADKLGQAPKQDLIDEKGLNFELRLADPVDMSNSILYDSGIMSLPFSDGWVSYENAKGVSACNDTISDTFIGFDSVSGEYNMPAWLKTPPQLAEIDKRRKAQISTSEQMPEPQLAPEAPAYEPVEPQTLIGKETPLEPLDNNFSPEPVKGKPYLHTVQLGAFQSAAIAQNGWVRYQQEAEYLREREHVLQPTNIDGLGILYRLRVIGFPDRGHAVDFCSRLKLDGVDCFVPNEK